GPSAIDVRVDFSRLPLSDLLCHVRVGLKATGLATDACRRRRTALPADLGGDGGPRHLWFAVPGRPPELSKTTGSRCAPEASRAAESPGSRCFALRPDAAARLRREG